jgi:hypothetical protein
LFGEDPRTYSGRLTIVVAAAGHLPRVAIVDAVRPLYMWLYAIFERISALEPVAA